MFKRKIKYFRCSSAFLLVIMIILSTVSGVCSAVPVGTPIYCTDEVSVSSSDGGKLRIIDTISVASDCIPHTAEDQDIPSSIWQFSSNVNFSGILNNRVRNKTTQSNTGQMFIDVMNPSISAEALLASLSDYLCCYELSSATHIYTTRKRE